MESCSVTGVVSNLGGDGKIEVKMRVTYEYGRTSCR